MIFTFQAKSSSDILQNEANEALTRANYNCDVILAEDLMELELTRHRNDKSIISCRIINKSD